MADGAMPKEGIAQRGRTDFYRKLNGALRQVARVFLSALDEMDGLSDDQRQEIRNYANDEIDALRRTLERIAEKRIVERAPNLVEVTTNSADVIGERFARHMAEMLREIMASDGQPTV